MSDDFEIALLKARAAMERDRLNLADAMAMQESQVRGEVESEERAVNAKSMGGSEEPSATGRALAEVKVEQADARLWTVVLGPPPYIQTEIDQAAGPLEPRDIFGVKARIEFGNGGVQSQVDLDWSRGGTYTVPGSFVRVSVSQDDRGQPAGHVYSDGALSAFIVPGCLAGPNHATHTVWVGDLDIGVASAVIGVPRFARAFSVYSGQSAASIIAFVDFFRNGGQRLAREYWRPNNAGKGYVEHLAHSFFHPEATECQVTNNTTVDMDDCSLTFYLDF